MLADPDLCRQIFTILLDNAVAYGLDDSKSWLAYASDTSDGRQISGEEKRKIVLRAESLRSHIMVYVIDHGPGIPDGEKELIFDRFYRRDQSRNRKEHFGLGLSIAAKLAQIQGIRLEVEDTAGGGSTFKVVI